MSVIVPIVAAGGAQSTVTLPDPVIGTGPTGIQQTLTTQATSDYNYPAASAYQPVGSPWWAFNNAESGVQGTLQIGYYPNNFPNYTTIVWSGTKFSYPEIIIGAQGPNHKPYVWGPNGTSGGQSSKPPSWVPTWVGQPLSALSHIEFSWDITYNTVNNTNFDTLTETWLGPAGTSTSYETCFMLKDPGWWGNKTAHQATINGVSLYFIPGGEPTSSQSLTIIPASVYAQGGNTPWLSGSIDLFPILSYAASQGWTSMSYALPGWEFGHEVGDASGMTGSATWNDLSFTVT